MMSYGLLTVPLIILTIGLFHGIVDGLTVTGSGMAVSMVAPPERLAGAQGLMGGLQTLIGGVAAALAGLNYEHLGRTVTFSVAAALMVTLVVCGLLFAGGAVRSSSPRFRKETVAA
jgi:zinc transporter ZupT